MAESGEEVDVLVQRVVKDISNAFKRNPNIDEIGVIPCPEARYNRSPIVLLENKLGVESWCIKFLLPYVHNKLLLYRQRKHWLDREALVDITSTLLLLNPDFTTAWNVRKELLQCGALSPEKDLYLGQLALTKFPKSPETWIHRRWVLQLILRQASAMSHKSPNNDGGAEQAECGRSQELSEHLSRTLHQEMKVCSDAAGRYPSNYNAWSHRIWVLQHMAQGNIKVFHDELSSTRLWVSVHVSDHSGFHYRQFLIKELMTQAAARPSQCVSSMATSNGEVSAAESVTLEQKQLSFTSVLQLFHQEMELCSDLMQSFPGHEALWSHRRHIFYLCQQGRSQLQGLCSRSMEDVESDHLTDGDPDPPLILHHSCAHPVQSVNGQRHTGEPMEVDGFSLSDPHNRKRLKRGVLVPNLPTLPSEHSFISSVLEELHHPEHRRFALAYRKWLDTVGDLQS
ncbi:protein prenyltransferase alpha subunit repeat-containing protein 1 [Gouania willdenowi]|uniref:Protein prenyltransferase alpha subunit repeat containing 1 n=1 Tax=Gouania willdenowi TaxID=441366 RepID=A0A8C5G8Z8_GOUWI|nr:protein prenyltransferase alpha subunit repeat-containing protein 1 [Gouania willdenowi]